MSTATRFQVARVPISLPCNVPVDPATGRADLPLEQRPERCATDAWWLVGAVPTCDDHFRLVCDIVEMSYDEVCRDMDFAPPVRDETPWLERHRYAQSECRNLGEEQP